MSYILEALKKAQAERQIGSTPSIHAPTLASGPAGQGTRSRRTPVIVAMALMVAAIAGLATMLVRQQSAANPPAATGAPATAASGVAAPAAVAPAAALTAAPGAGTFNAPAAPTVSAAGIAPDAPVAASAPARAGAVPAAAALPAARQAPVAMATAPARAPDTLPAQRDTGPQPSVQRTAEARVAQQSPTPAAAEAPQLPPKKQAVPVVAPPVATAPVEEQVQSLRELPEPIQRAIPQIALGGYMYSKNPADRLLLIDKVLRREGEEVAPGLILDKLQPKQAIFSFRGYRYRVPL